MAGKAFVVSCNPLGDDQQPEPQATESGLSRIINFFDRKFPGYKSDTQHPVSPLMGCFSLQGTEKSCGFRSLVKSGLVSRSRFLSRNLGKNHASDPGVYSSVKLFGHSEEILNFKIIACQKKIYEVRKNEKNECST